MTIDFFPHNGRVRHAALILAFLTLSFAAYYNSLHAPFIFDGRIFIENEPRIRQLWPLERVFEGSSRPITRLTFALNYAIGQLDVVGYHLTNQLIHVLASLVLFGLVRRTLLSPRLRARFGESAGRIAFAAALLWMLHPLQTESVTYIYQRSESLMGLFYLLTLYAFARSFASVRPSSWRLAGIVFCGLGMGSKVVMLTAPVMVLWYDRVFWADSYRTIWLKRRGFYAGLALSWIWLIWLGFMPTESSATIGPEATHITPLKYALSQPRAILHYLKTSVWPEALVLDYGWAKHSPLPIMLARRTAVTALIGLIAWNAVRRPAAGFLGVWFFLILLPTSSFFPINDPVVEHRMYLPLAALVVGAVVAVHEWTRRRFRRDRVRVVAQIVTLAVVASGLCWATHRRNEDYRSHYAVWRDVVSKRPHNPRARVNLANCLVERGEYHEAVEHYKKAFDERKRGRLFTRVTLAKMHYNLAGALQGLKNQDGAIRHYRSALKAKPDYVDARSNLAMALADKGLLDEATRELRKAIAEEPHDAWLRVNLGVVFQEKGRDRKAMRQFWRAVWLDPGFADAHNNLALMLAKRGWMKPALAHMRLALRLQPNDPDLRRNLAEMTGESKRLKMSVRL